MHTAEVRRAVRTQLARSLRALAREEERDQAIHEARKALKRARTGLELLKKTIQPAMYAHEKERLRGIARQLAEVRDDKVQVDTLAALAKEERHPERREVLIRLKDESRRRQREHWSAMEAADSFEHIEQALRESARRIHGWHDPVDGASALERALVRLYRKSRKAFRKSKKSRRDETLHEARKRAKHLVHALEIVAKEDPPRRAGKVLKRLEKMGDWLGEDHDLAVLESNLMHSEAGPEDLRRKLCKAIEDRRTKLQKKALRRGRRVFRGKTRKLLTKLSEATKGT
ncbi:MAG: CHAD domain-containing protein [Betaproteobacteria bacterium]|nr:CHAD domain-containing protein [Betaproteobacteria bacterium]